MRFHKILFVLLFVFFFISCESQLKYDEEDYDCDYSSCTTEEPFYADLQINFTRNEENPNPTIYVVSGYYEENTVIKTIKTDTIENYMFSVTVPVNINSQYCVYAVYKKGNDTITAIDGAYVYKDYYNVCDSVCWRTHNSYFNIKLKK